MYSALRDTASQQVRVFLDAEAWVRWEWAIFARSNQDWQDIHQHQKVECLWQSLTPPQDLRRVNGYMMSCPDPGEDFRYVILADNGEGDVGQCTILSARIEAISSSTAHDSKQVGACMAPMFSNHEYFAPWLEHAAAIGVQHAYVYFTLPAAGQFLREPKREEHQLPFTPIASEIVTYYYFLSPAYRHYYGQSTLYNECIFRNRNAYRYLIMSDADEFLHMTHPGPTLAATLDATFPHNSSSVLLDVMMYNPDCPANKQALHHGNQSFADSGSWFIPSLRQLSPPKSIVSPVKVDTFHIHGVQWPAERFQRWHEVSRRQMYFKHMKHKGDCKNAIVNDRDPEDFAAAMDALDDSD